MNENKTARLGELFGHLWPAYVGESASVDLLPRAAKSPFFAATVWHGGRYHIIGDSTEPPRLLFLRLMHETAHARFRHLPRKGCADPDLLRRVFTGEEDNPEWVSGVRRSVANAKATKARMAQEHEAREWADGEVEKLWPLVEEYLDASESEARELLAEVDEAVKSYNLEV